MLRLISVTPGVMFSRPQPESARGRVHARETANAAASLASCAIFARIIITCLTARRTIRERRDFFESYYQSAEGRRAAQAAARPEPTQRSFGGGQKAWLLPAHSYSYSPIQYPHHPA